MSNDATVQGLEQEMQAAIEDLRTHLQRASDATASIQRLIPRLTTIGSLFDDLAAVINSGREQLGIAGSAPAPYSRPTLLVPSAQPPLMTEKDPWTELSNAWGSNGETAAPEHVASGTLVSFRLEFESQPGPLDLRAVDDAVSEHPSVRDVALLDYDGRKATLKVWIEEKATPSDVHASLVEKAAALFGPENEVTVIAIDEAA